jgi:hypothetical protein
MPQGEDRDSGAGVVDRSPTVRVAVGGLICAEVSDDRQPFEVEAQRVFPEAQLSARGLGALGLS